MRESIAFYLRLFGLIGCLWFACVIFFAPLFFTFSRDELTQSPKLLVHYLRHVEMALENKDLERARYFMKFIDRYNGQLISSDMEKERLESAVQLLHTYDETYRAWMDEYDYWGLIDTDYPNFRDAKYMTARAAYALQKDGEARGALEQSLYLDPQCDYCKNALSIL